MDNKITIHIGAKVGYYGYDKQGKTWSTFSCVNDWGRTCKVCGKNINSGWVRGNNYYVCAEHVETDR